MKTNLIKVPCQKDQQGYPFCMSESFEYCYFWQDYECVPYERYPACLKEGIIWLEVKDD